MGDLTRNFSKSELCCKHCGEYFFDAELLGMLQDARDRAGIPFHVSGCRCKAHNSSIGGVEDSMHIYGLAVDITTYGSQNAFIILFALRDAGFTRFRIYRNNIHVDIGDRRGKIIGNQLIQYENAHLPGFSVSANVTTTGNMELIYAIISANRH